MNPPATKESYHCEKCGLSREFPIGFHRDGRLGIWGKVCEGSPRTFTYDLKESSDG